MNVEPKIALIVVAMSVPVIGGAYLLRAQVVDHEERIQSVEENVGVSAAWARYGMCVDLLERDEIVCKREFWAELAKIEVAEASEGD